MNDSVSSIVNEIGESEMEKAWIDQRNWEGTPRG